MAQWFRETATLGEALELPPNAHIGSSRPPVAPDLGDDVPQLKIKINL